MLAAEVGRAVTPRSTRLEPRRRQLVHELFYLPERDYEQVSRSMGMPVGSIGPTRGRRWSACAPAWIGPASTRGR